MAAIIREAMPSQRLSPVRIAAVVPAAATKIPTTAAESSKTTMNAGGSFDWRNASHQPRLRVDCLNARAPMNQEPPSNTKDAASTRKITSGLSMGCGCRRRWIPW